MGGFEGDFGVVSPQSSFSRRGTRDKLLSRGNQNHSTSCLFLQRFVESEREFLNSLFLTNRSTFVLHGISLSESLLVASSILYSFFLSRARILFERAWASPPLQLSPRQENIIPLAFHSFLCNYFCKKKCICGFAAWEFSPHLC